MQYLITLLLLLTGLVFTMAQPRPNFQNLRPKEFQFPFKYGQSHNGLEKRLSVDIPFGKGVKVQPYVDGSASISRPKITGGGLIFEKRY